MGKSILKLRVVWNGSNYDSRLELGDAALNGPVDIRFIDEPGAIEYAHSIWFGVNRTDAYSSGGMISTSVAGDLVFFDPSNSVGRTLTQLYEHVDELWGITTENAWEDLTGYSLTDYVAPSVPNSHSYECSIAGTSGATEPTWPTTDELTVVDGSITWTCKSVRTKLTDASDIDMQGKKLTTSDGSDLKFAVSTGHSFIFSKV